MSSLSDGRAGNKPGAEQPEYLTLTDLAVHGITAAHVRRCRPLAVEYRALDGSPCWRREDLAPLLAEEAQP
jgi:hypothetical protein